MSFIIFYHKNLDKVLVLNRRFGSCKAVKLPSTRPVQSSQWSLAYTDDNYFRAHWDEIRCAFAPPYILD